MIYLVGEKCSDEINVEGSMLCCSGEINGGTWRLLPRESETAADQEDATGGTDFA